MSSGKKLLIVFGVIALVMFGGCGAVLWALGPGDGPEMLLAVPSDADIIVYAEDLSGLWRKLERSESMADFLRGPTGRMLAESLEVESLEMSGPEARKARFAIDRIGREAAVAVWVDSRTRQPAEWLVAGRIGRLGRLGDLLAGAFGPVETVKVDGRKVRRTDQAQWTLWGDLLVAASDAETLSRALEGVAARTGADGTFAGLFRSNLERLPGRQRVGVRIGRPEAFLGSSEKTSSFVQTIGLPAPVDLITFVFAADDDRLLEEAFVASPASLREVGRAPRDIAPPPGTYFWWRFRPGREEAGKRIMEMLAMLEGHGGVGTTSTGLELFRTLILPKVGSEIAIALAEQEARGFPAQFSFVRMEDASLLSAGFEQILRMQSMGVYSPAKPHPTTYPYVVRRMAGDRPLYEMVVRDVRRFDGFRPAVAVRFDDIVYCSSMDALTRLIEAGRVAVPLQTIIPEALSDRFLATGGLEVLRLEWRPPSDFAPLKNAFDYAAETRRFGAPVRQAMTDTTDYETIWTVASDALARIEAHSRVGLEEAGGLRMRAVWRFRPLPPQ